jgi:hypothetical protein
MNSRVNASAPDAYGNARFYSQIVFAISLSRCEVLTPNYQEYRKSLGSLLSRDCISEQRRRPPQF